MRRVLSLLLKVLLGLGLLLVLAVVGVLVALRVPRVQTDVAHRVARLLTEKLGQQVLIGSVDVRPFSRVLLDEVRVNDRRGGEIFSVGRADADISLFSVFDPRHLHISKVILNEPRFELKNLPGQPDSTTFDQFMAAVRRLTGPADTTKSAPFDFKIAEIGLRNGHFAIEKMGDPREPTYGRTIDYDHLLVDSIYADLSNIRLADTLAVRISHAARRGNAFPYPAQRNNVRYAIWTRLLGVQTTCACKWDAA